MLLLSTEKLLLKTAICMTLADDTLHVFWWDKHYRGLNDWVPLNIFYGHVCTLLVEA